MKIAKDTIKRQYELTYLVPTVYSAGEVSKIKDEIEALVKKYKGKVVNTEEWGKKTLAYPIKKAGKKFDEAFYFHYLIEFDPSNVQEFRKFLRLNHEVIRFLFVLADDESSQAETDKVNREAREGALGQKTETEKSE